MSFMADQLFQTFPRVLRPLFATLPLFTTFLVCQISLVVNIVESCRLIEGVYIKSGRKTFVETIFTSDNQLIG